MCDVVMNGIYVSTIYSELFNIFPQINDGIVCIIKYYSETCSTMYHIQHIGIHTAY